MKVKKVCIIIAIASIVLGSGLVRGSDLFWPIFIIIGIVGFSRKSTMVDGDFQQLQHYQKKQGDFSRKIMIDHQRRLKYIKHRHHIMTAGHKNMTSRRMNLGG